MNNIISPKVIGLDRYRDSTRSEIDQGEVARLALRLQQTLEIAPLMQSFCQETARIIPCDSVRYANPNPLFNYQTGHHQNHRCRYQLELDGELLGEIETTRTTPFTLLETEQIERLLSVLIYPLRNALLYQKALSEAHRDPLTQISNRAAFDQALEREICGFKRHHECFSLMVIDLDHFKRINDTYGHIVGDKVLKLAAQAIKNTIRRSDEVFRYGGEEFVVLLSKTELPGARFIAERVRREIRNLSLQIEENVQISASIGISASRTESEVSDTLYHADKALYQAKAEGRDRVVVRP